MADWDDYDDHAGFDDGGGFGAGPAAGAAADDDWSEADSFNEPLPEADGFGDPTGAGEDAAYDKLYGMMSPSRAPSLQPSRVVGASRILRPADVDALRASLETEVMQAAHVSRDVASALLRDRKWNVESVTGLLFDGRDAAFAAAGIASWAEKEYRPSDYSPLLATAPAATAATGADPDAAAAPTATAPATSASSPEPTELCAVCYDDCARSLFLTTPCGHAFCLPCWLQYIFSELSRTRNAVRLHCLQHKCPAIVGDRLVRAAAAAAAAAQKQGLLPAELTLAAPATPEMIAAAETLVRTLAATAVPPAAAATAAASAASETAAPGSSAKKAPPAAAAAAVPAVPAAAPAPVDVAILGRWDLMLPSLGCIVRRSLVEDSRRLQWCPGRNCDLAVQPAPGATAFTCECGHEYCLQCGHDEPHAPAPCQTVQKWTALVSKEGDNAQWLMYNTKLCPHCRVRIEKNSGCNHMSCTSCRYEFCWICMGSWQSHTRAAGAPADAYRCNKFREGEEAANALATDDTQKVPTIDQRDLPNTATAASAEETENRRTQQRILFYFTRYHNHLQGQRFATRARGVAMETKMLAVQARKLRPASETEAAWLNEANEELIAAQRVLKYSYAVGYFQAEGAAKNLFEFSQQLLVQVAERLAELLEETVVSRINPAEVRDAAMQARERCAALIKDISNVFPDW